MYTSIEIEYAQQQGYHILCFYEAYQYAEKAKPFETYIKTLAYLKIKVSTVGWLCSLTKLK